MLISWFVTINVVKGPQETKILGVLQMFKSSFTRALPIVVLLATLSSPAFAQIYPTPSPAPTPAPGPAPAPAPAPAPTPTATPAPAPTASPSPAPTTTTTNAVPRLSTS